MRDQGAEQWRRSDRGPLDLHQSAAGDGGVHLTVLLRDGRAIAPRRLELVRLTDGSRTTLAPPNFSRRFPEFVTKAGDHQYEITPLGDSSASLRCRWRSLTDV